MKIIFTVALTILLLHQGICQEQEKLISISVNNESLSTYLERLSSLAGTEFSYNPAEINADTIVSIDYKNVPLGNILGDLANFQIEYLMLEDHIVLRKIRNEDNLVSSRKKPSYTLTGNITDSESGESLIGATIGDLNTGKGTAANGYGFYTLTLPEGEYNLYISYLGYTSKSILVDLKSNRDLNISLDMNVSVLDEVIIKSEEKELVIENLSISQVQMKSSSFSQIPGFLGEPDVIKSLQSLPGINFFSDGSTIFHVRGGDRDQNMILVDEAPVYNPAHLLGIFSAFTPESINSINIYKGDMPASFGGRLSSVIDIKLKEGNVNNLVFSGNTGPVATTLNLQGPMFKGRSSFFVSARRSHLKWLIVDQAPSVRKLYFSDFNIKYNFRINSSNRLFLSLYSGIDNFINGENPSHSTGISWINTAGNLRWNHVFGKRLFSNTSFIISNYDYNLFVNVAESQRWNTGISLGALKTDFSFYPGSESVYRMGFNLATHFYSPGNFYIGYFTNPVQKGVSPRQAVESSLYFSFENNLGSMVNINYGLRLTSWTNSGPATEYVYNRYFDPVDTLTYTKNQRYHTYTALEPRINLRIKPWDQISFKLALSRNSQFEYLISNSISPFTSMETWLPAGPNIKPLHADQITAALTINSRNNMYSANIESFYKHISNYISYVDHANMLFNPHVEGELRYGDARSYGFEIMSSKSDGRLQGWISYTFTRTLLNIPDLNNGRDFPAGYDRPHNFGIFTVYRLKSRWTLSANWLCSSGNPITTPTGYYIYNDYQVPFYEERNNDRLPAYHRLDLATEIDFTRKGSSFVHSLKLSVFNAYGRKNPFIINFNKIINDSGALVVPTDHSDTPDLQSSMTYIYGLVPSLSYHFKF